VPQTGASTPASTGVVVVPQNDCAAVWALVQSPQAAQAIFVPPEKTNDSAHALPLNVVHCSYVSPSVQEPISVQPVEAGPSMDGFPVSRWKPPSEPPGHVFVSAHGRPPSAPVMGVVPHRPPCV
jgi:hypothetical protein